MKNTIRFIAKITSSVLIFSVLAFVKVSAAPHAVWADYFGTGKTDYFSIGGSSGGNLLWDVLRNPVTNPPQTRRTYWGFAFDPQTGTGDIPVFGDWDGDLKIDVAVWRPGNAQNPQSYFYIQPSSNPNGLIAQPWGKSNNFPNDTDFPVTGDFDGDGKTDFCVVRKVGNQLVWYILPSGGGNFRSIPFGAATDGFNFSSFDFNNDGRDDLIVFRIDSQGAVTHYIGDATTGALILAQQWGGAAVADLQFFYGNYTGDSRADIVAYYGTCNASNPNCGAAGTFWIKETGSSNYTATKWGFPANFQTGDGDFPDFGDYDGDGKFDISVFRPPNNTFYTILSSNGQYQFQQWGGLPSFAAKSVGEVIPAGVFTSPVIFKQSDGTFSIERGAVY